MPSTNANTKLAELADRICLIIPDFVGVDREIRTSFQDIVQAYIQSEGSPPTNILHQLLERVRSSGHEDVGLCNRCGLFGFEGTNCGCNHTFGAPEERPINEQLKPYNYRIANNKQDFRSLKDDPEPHLYLGVELEVYSTVGGTTNFPTLIEQKLTDGFCIVKSDGSLGSDSFEINSRPATLSFHKADTWKAFFAEAPSKVSGEVDGYGMHIHVSRTVLSPLTIGKFLLFMNSDHNENFITKIAGRGNHDYSEPKKDHKLKDPLLNRQCNNPKRYSRVNTLNKHTLEIRMFQSTVNEAKFFANLEFADAATRFCETAGMRHMTHEYFCKWINKKQNKARYPNLFNFLSAHKLVKDTRAERPTKSSFKE